MSVTVEHECPRHPGRGLRRGEVCQLCVLDPGAALEPTSEDTDRELLAVAAEYLTRERLLWRHAENLLEDGTSLDKNTGAKLSAESAKWARLAREIKGEVSQRKQLREAMAHEREMSGKRGRS